MTDFAILLNPITFFVYFLFCAVVALQGDDHRCGWLYPLIISIFLTPIAGMFIVLTSKHKKTHDAEQALMEYLRKQKQ